MPRRNIVVLGTAGPVTEAVAWAMGSPAADIAEPIRSEPDGVVIVAGTDPAPVPSDAAALDEAGWNIATEKPMHRALIALQHAWSALAARGGRIVVVVPSIGASGAAGLVPYITAVEGIRALTKSAARQWASAGIGVNLVAVPVDLLHPGAGAFATHLTAAAVPDDHSMIDTIVESVDFLLRPDLTHLTGATLVADGGSLMLP